TYPNGSGECLRGDREPETKKPRPVTGPGLALVKRLVVDFIVSRHLELGRVHRRGVYPFDFIMGREDGRHARRALLRRLVAAAVALLRAEQAAQRAIQALARVFAGIAVVGLLTVLVGAARFPGHVCG